MGEMTDDSYTKETMDATVSRIDGKIDSLDVKVDRNFAGVYERQDKTNGRLRFVEKLAWIAIGGLGASSIDSMFQLVSNIFL